MYQNYYFYNNNPYNYNRYFRVESETQLVNDIERAINGEYSAIACYQQLAKMAPTQAERNQILEIREDEMRHFKAFSGIYTTLTGKQPTPEIIEECPDTYKGGLEASFKDEQETVDFYLDIADSTQAIVIKETFRRAAAVQGEIDNITMYENFLSYELPPDVRTVFTQLRNASLNHLAAFERGLARE